MLYNLYIRSLGLGHYYVTIRTLLFGSRLYMCIRVAILKLIYYWCWKSVVWQWVTRAHFNRRMLFPILLLNSEVAVALTCFSWEGILIHIKNSAIEGKHAFIKGIIVQMTFYKTHHIVHAKGYTSPQYGEPSQWSRQIRTSLITVIRMGPIITSYNIIDPSCIHALFLKSSNSIKNMSFSCIKI